VDIAILGTGFVGGALGRRWAAEGHNVVYGSRDPEGSKAVELLAASPGAKVTSIADAAQGAGVVVLATPWPAAEATLKAAGDLQGKVLVDCVNPINATFTGLDLGFDASAGEAVADWAPGAKVVKAFNTVSAATMDNADFGEHLPAMFFCGDDEEAKQTVAQLAKDLGLEAFDAGDLTMSRYLEPFAMLYIKLAIKQKWGGDCAFKVLRR